MSLSIPPAPVDPHLRRWMLFVDGENFTIRGQSFAESNQLTLNDADWFVKDAFLWIRGRPATEGLTNHENMHIRVQPHATRAFYYTTMSGDDDKLQEARRKLHHMGFSPKVFKKPRKDKKTKGVDITLATDMLSNAYNDNFDVAVLAAGDGDFAPLVNEVKRLGKVVYVFFFSGDENGLNEELVLASDGFVDASTIFRNHWAKR